jgi:2-C-methyl-D-erythritol 2,4-cyclodiphosphate synthase
MIRVGIGYDSHRFAPPGPMVLGGVSIPAGIHLDGHSDGDAIAHALTDAVLGAMGAGDIGQLFPNTSPLNKGRNSIEMLRLAVERVNASGWRVAQVDIVVLTEEPKIGAHREAMCEVLARALGVKQGDVSIKGKTNEKMGWIGRGEGLACMVVATITNE